MSINQIVPKSLLRQRVDGLTFGAGTTTQVKVPKGMLTDHFVLSIAYQIVITGTATSIRATGVPIKAVRLVADNGVVLKSWRPRDLINRSVYYKSAPLGSLVAPPGATSGTVTGRADIVLPFGEPKATDLLRFKTALPTWLYNELYLVVDWGDMNEVFVPAAATGVFSLVAGGGGTGLSVSAYQWDKYDPGQNPIAFAQSQGVVYESFTETASAAANRELTIDLPRTEDIRAVMIQVEDANNEPTSAILNAITLEENNTVNRISRLDANQVRAVNGQEFQLVTSPSVGLYVLEFAPDEDISSGLIAATSMTALKLKLDVAATSCTIRVHTIRPGLSKIAA